MKKNLQRKELHIDKDAIRRLTIDGIKKGFANFKEYAEHILNEVDKKLPRIK